MKQSGGIGCDVNWFSYCFCLFKQLHSIKWELPSTYRLVIPKWHLRKTSHSPHSKNPIRLGPECLCQDSRSYGWGPVAQFVGRWVEFGAYCAVSCSQLWLAKCHIVTHGWWGWQVIWDPSWLCLPRRTICISRLSLSHIHSQCKALTPSRATPNEITTRCCCAGKIANLLAKKLQNMFGLIFILNIK